LVFYPWPSCSARHMCCLPTSPPCPVGDFPPGIFLFLDCEVFPSLYPFFLSLLFLPAPLYNLPSFWLGHQVNLGRVDPQHFSLGVFPAFKMLTHIVPSRKIPETYFQLNDVHETTPYPPPPPKTARLISQRVVFFSFFFWRSPIFFFP